MLLISGVSTGEFRCILFASGELKRGLHLFFVDFMHMSIDFQWMSLILGLFSWILVDLGGFHGFQCPRFSSLWQPAAAFAAGQLPLKEDCRLQSWRSWMHEGLEAGVLDPGAFEADWISCWLAGRLGLDWI